MQHLEVGAEAREGSLLFEAHVIYEFWVHLNHRSRLRLRLPVLFAKCILQYFFWRLIRVLVAFRVVFRRIFIQNGQIIQVLVRICPLKQFCKRDSLRHRVLNPR